jgi:two-component system, LytTR family, response regulator
MITSDIISQNIVYDVESGFLMENNKNIEYCYAKQSYSATVTYLGKKMTISKSLKEIQQIFPKKQFYRTHKSTLINIYYIRKFLIASESYVLLKSGVKVPVSVRVSSAISKDIKKMLEN